MAGPTCDNTAENQARLQTLSRLRRWYQETKNPLYAWEAIARCLHDDPPTIPEWCLNYLRDAASNIFDLSRRKDFRNPKSPAFKLSTEQAAKLVAEGLLLSKQGKRNAFAALLKDRDDLKDANSVGFYGAGALEEIAERRNVSKDRAQRITARGKRLAGPVKPSP